MKVFLSYIVAFFILTAAASAQLCERSFDEPCLGAAGGDSHEDDIHDGDGVLPAHHVIHGKNKRGVLSYKPWLWPNGTICYQIGPGFTNEQLNIIYDGMANWENKTCIRFIDEACSDGYVQIRVSQYGCCSYVGRVGCKQGLSLNPNCFSKRTVIHELGHAIGLFHEQSRPDRDKYVRILPDNIIPGARELLQSDVFEFPPLVPNFNKLASFIVDSLGVPYDYNSVMHYSNKAFVKSPELVNMIPLTPGITVGRSVCLSPLDAIQINKLYKCHNPALPPIERPHHLIEDDKLVLKYPNCGAIYTVNHTTKFTISHIHTLNLDCQYIIDVVQGFQIDFAISMSIEYSGGGSCNKDYINFNLTRYNLLFGPYCGNLQVSLSAPVTASSIYLNYHTDGGDSYFGNFAGFTATITPSDIDECNLHLCSHNCTNTVGSYICTCPDGWYLSCDQRTCFDINECAYNNGGCNHNCTNTAGSHYCSCSEGFKLGSDQKTCSNNNQNLCQSPLNNCDHNCFGNSSAVVCTCRAGFVLAADQHTCHDINECIAGNQCSHGCANTYGSYQCTCRLGYTLEADGKTCVDINECQTIVKPEHNCASCTNLEGDYLCICKKGYTYGADLHTCVDENECTAGTHGCSHTCTNTVGSYTCSCPSGWVLGSNSKTCDDINECASGQHGCSHTCTNTAGSFICDCPSGWVLGSNSKTCSDENECTAGTDGCSHTCTNTVGSYTCSCPSGWMLGANSKTCDDINECSDKTHRCNHTCTNTVGSYICSCPTGLVLAKNARNCTDINECSDGTHQCSHTCSNTIGSYICSCPSGWKLSTDNKKCLQQNSSGGIISLTDSSGTINVSSSNPSALHQYKIALKNVNNVIKLKLLSVQVPCSEGGYITIYNGGDIDTAMVMGNYCGDSITKEMTSSINELIIVYSTTSQSSGSLTYTSTSSNFVKGCVRLIYIGQQFSPDTFPLIHNETKDCTFYVFSSRPPVFQLLYTDLDFNTCTSDNRISIHSSFDMSTNIGVICNGKTSKTRFTSTANYMIIRYVVKKTKKYRGFAAKIL